MSADIKIDITVLSNEQKTRLEGLLDQLDLAVAERKVFVDSAQADAMRAYFKNPSTPIAAHDYIALFTELDDARFPALLAEMLQDLRARNAEDVAARLETLELPEQKKIIGYVSSAYTWLCDEKKERQLWKKVSRIYNTILSEFPRLLTSVDDATGAVKLGQMIESKKGSLSFIWPMATNDEKMKRVSDILKSAYPKDDVDHMHIASVDIKTVAAAFTDDGVDTMMCGPQVLEGKIIDLSLFLIAHEFQHRRQQRLIDRLKRGELTKGNEDYYRARLFKANFSGGYLSAGVARGKIGMFAKFRDYVAQPVEQDANNHARISSVFGATAGQKIWDLNEKVSRVLSATARPLDKIAYGCRRVFSFGKKR